MLEEARERRRLRRNLAESRRLEAPHLSWGEPDFDALSEEFLKARAKVRMAEHAIEHFETYSLSVRGSTVSTNLLILRVGPTTVRPCHHRRK